MTVEVLKTGDSNLLICKVSIQNVEEYGIDHEKISYSLVQDDNRVEMNGVKMKELLNILKSLEDEPVGMD